MKTVERIVENAILEKGKRYVIGGHEYTVAPPSTATLIEVSSYISEQTNAQETESDYSRLIEALRVSRGTTQGDIAATLVLGAKGKRNPPITHKWLKLFPRKANYKRIKQHLLEDWSPEKLSEMILDCLSNSEFGFFLQTTIFLSEVNLTKVTKTTQSGQSS